eukprot:10849139-Alexandrium_andersonii.AAC.1
MPHASGSSVCSARCARGGGARFSWMPRAGSTDEATGKINGVIFGHVDDLLFAGGQAAYASFQELCAEL